MPTPGYIKDANGSIVAEVVMTADPLPPQEWDSVDTREVPVAVAGTASEPRICATEATPIHWTQAREHQVFTTYGVTTEPLSGSMVFGWTLTIIGAIALLAVSAGAAGFIEVPALATAATAVAPATVTTAGTITMALGTTVVGAGQTIVWGATLPPGYTRGAILGVQAADVNVGDPVAQPGEPTQGPPHPCQ